MINSKIIAIIRDEPNFDRACDEAYRQALRIWDVDEDGHINGVPDSERSTDSIVVEFTKYHRTGGMGGQSNIYDFLTTVHRMPDAGDGTGIIL